MHSYQCFLIIASQRIQNEDFKIFRTCNESYDSLAEVVKGVQDEKRACDCYTVLLTQLGGYTKLSACLVHCMPVPCVPKIGQKLLSVLCLAESLQLHGLTCLLAVYKPSLYNCHLPEVHK